MMSKIQKQQSKAWLILGSILFLFTLCKTSVLLAQDPSSDLAPNNTQNPQQKKEQTQGTKANLTESSMPNREYAENYVFSDPNQRKVFLELTAELRCPLCQNQNIADSDAPIAHDMRRKVYQLMQEGNNKPEVIAWMKQRYGDFVHYQPPLTFATIWLWLTPVIFALLMFVFFIKRRKIAEPEDQAEKLARADHLLEDE